MLSLHLPISIPNYKPKHSFISLSPNPTTAPTVSSPGIQTLPRRLFLPPPLVARADSIVAVREGEEEGKDGGVSEELPEGLRRDLIPRHVAIIMDGNARWAKQRGLLASAGHEEGVRSLREIVELCRQWGIRVLTVFAFSTDNWIRPQVEVEFLMSLFERILKSELDTYVRDGTRISVIGDSSRLPESLRNLINEIEESTKENSKIHLLVAVSYSGKYDVVQACRTIASKAKDGSIQLEDLDETLIENELETNCAEYPYPDLLIRTSGELRISNFLLWQLAYTELFFSEALWPDFGKDEFVEALASFQQRKRRFGTRK